MTRAVDAGLKPGFAKIKEITEAQICRAKVGQDLFGMYRQQLLNRFELEKDSFLNNQISAVPLVEGDLILDDWDRFLYFDR